LEQERDGIDFGKNASGRELGKGKKWCGKKGEKGLRAGRRKRAANMKKQLASESLTTFPRRRGT